MLFSSITFLYYFLPITLLVYFLVPERGKNVVLLAASFLFYFWGEPRYCMLMVGTVLVGYIGGIWIEYAGENERMRDAFKKSIRKKSVLTGEKKAAGRSTARWIKAAFVGLVLGILLLFKYADFLLQSVNSMTGSELPLLKLALPLGISFYTFQIISYLVDVGRKEIVAEKNFINFAAYVMMFPQLIAGPIVRYSTIAAEMKNRKLNFRSVADGGSRFACGLAKKVLIADVLSELVQKLDKIGTGGLGVIGSWVLATAFTLQIYYDFSGYSDMAIGLGRMQGFTFPENFDHPLAAKNITEFWRRWHMTLGGWFRDYVYIPLGGSRVKFGHWLLNVLAVWFLSGLWHGANWNFALWGLYFALFLIVEKVVRKLITRFRGSETRKSEHGAWQDSGKQSYDGTNQRASVWQKDNGQENVKQNKNGVHREDKWKQSFLHESGRAAGHLYTVAVVVVSFVIFRQENLGIAWANLQEMFGAGGMSVSSPIAWYEIKNYGFLLAASAFGAMPCVNRVVAYFDTKKKLRKCKEWLQPVVTILFLLVSTAFIIGSSAHPFLYFRF